VSPSETQSLLRLAAFTMLRWETPFTPCTGITAVSAQERRTYTDAIVVAPWCPNLERARAAVASGEVVYTGWRFSAGAAEVRVFAAVRAGLAPILYLAIDGHFAGRADPYDTPQLPADALLFGVAAEALFHGGPPPASQFGLAADWETVPALLLLRAHRHMILQLHNEYDAWLAPEAARYDRREFDALRTQTALQAGIRAADVVTAVNRGYAYGLRHEVIHNRVMASHLVADVGRIVGVDNAGFDPVSPAVLELADTISRNPANGVGALARFKLAALDQLPAEIRDKARGKVIVVTMGRRVAQKLHDVFVAAVRAVLARQPDLPLLIVFATTSGDAGSDARLGRIRELAAALPENVVWTDGRVQFYQSLMNAAHFNGMWSLTEPHGGAFCGSVIPLARSIDGLAAQICAYRPRGTAARLNDFWHAASEPACGLMFREEEIEGPQGDRDLAELLTFHSAPANPTFVRMTDELSAGLRLAVDLCQKEPVVYANLVAAAVRKQGGRTWDDVRRETVQLLEESRLRRPLGGAKGS
jgi:glycosyltransferase involved in cell wall biosynthesis